MKKMLTKMLAVAMAWAMLLSCTVMASATHDWSGMPTGAFTPETDPAAADEYSQSGVGGEGAVTGAWGAKTADTDETNYANLMIDSTGTHNYASGRATGTSHNEGRVPADVIRLMMPTVGKNALDMILDPHGLINTTKAARYGGSDAASFSDSKVYFLTSYGNNKSFYSDKSQALTIENRSSVPVSVNLSLRANKGSGSDGFHFVSSGAVLTESGPATMKLSLNSSDGQQQYVTEVGSSALMHTWKYTESSQLVPESLSYLELSFTDGTTANPGLVGVTGQSLVKEDVGSAKTYSDVTSDGTFQFLTSDGKLRRQLAASLTAASPAPQVTLEVIVGSGGGTGEPWATAYPQGKGIAVYSNGNILKISANSIPVADGANTVYYDAMIQPDYLTQYTDIKSTGYVLNTTVEVPVSVLYYKHGDAKKTPVAAMYFNIAPGDLSKKTAGTAAAITVKPVKSDGDGLVIAAFADIQSSIGAAKNAYATAYDKDAGYYKVYREEAPDAYESFAPASAQGTANPAQYERLSFYLQCAIGGYESGSWDIIGGDITLDLVWDVYAEPALRGDKPGVTVAKKPIGTGKGFTLNWTAGTEDYADYVPDTTVTLNTGTNLPMVLTNNATTKTLAGSTITGTQLGSATSVTVTFKAEGKKDLKVTVAL